jgi:hypothetical protein
MRADLKAALQERWETSLRERAKLNSRSAVPALDTILIRQRGIQVSGREHSTIRRRTRRIDGRSLGHLGPAILQSLPGEVAQYRTSKLPSAHVALAT